MPQYVVLIVNENPDEQSRISNTLNSFQPLFRMASVFNTGDAEREVYAISETDERLALVICDEALPQESGTSFLMRLHQDSRTRPAHKILVMHEPDAEVLIQAINHGGLDHCLVPPWNEEQLSETVKEELTDFILDHEFFTPHAACRMLAIVNRNGDRRIGTPGVSIESSTNHIPIGLEVFV